MLKKPEGDQLVAVKIVDGGRMKEITILLTGFMLGYEETIDALINMD